MTVNKYVNGIGFPLALQTNPLRKRYVSRIVGMESKLLKVKLRPNSKPHFFELLQFIKVNPEAPKSEMLQKGYFWDSFFLDKDENLFMVLKSQDFSKIMMDESELLQTAFRPVYERFRTQCWIEGSYEDIEELFCFNDSFSFLGLPVET